MKHRRLVHFVNSWFDKLVIALKLVSVLWREQFVAMRVCAFSEQSIENAVSVFGLCHCQWKRLLVLQLVHEETCKNLDKAQEDNERLSRKLEVVTADYGELQRSTAATDAELRVTVRDLRARLNTYEQIEKVTTFIQQTLFVCFCKIVGRTVSSYRREMWMKLVLEMMWWYSPFCSILISLVCFLLPRVCWPFPFLDVL